MGWSLMAWGQCGESKGPKKTRASSNSTLKNAAELLLAGNRQDLRSADAFGFHARQILREIRTILN